MGRVRICIGNYAKTPHEIRQAGIRVYCLEELCYYLCRNAFLLDGDFITSELIEWIERELELKELSKDLYTMLRNDSPTESFVMRILEEGNYCDGAGKREILRVIQENAKLNIYEKKKKRIDYMAATGRYEQALSEYHRLLLLVAGKDISLTGAVYNAMGSAAARIFHFALAEELFEKAYRLTYRRESLFCYICAVKLHGTEEEHQKKLSAIPEAKELEAEADQAIADCAEKWRETESYMRLSSMREMWEDGKPVAYYEQVERTTDELKEEYRRMTAH